MTQRRLAITLVAIALATSSSSASQVESEPSVREVMSQMEKLVQHVDQLEQRVIGLEALLIATPAHVDERGIIRDTLGRPIGVWGIDPALEAAR